jgi:DNA polymerase III subunit epsilon
VRQVVIDTETTGLDPTLGHRIIEIAAVEIVDRRLTGNNFHRYVDPERDSEEAALQIHGLTREFLSDKPKFKDVVQEFLEFVQGAELVIHNAGFDIAFIDWELSLLYMQPVATCCACVIDTLKIAREMHPGKRNALDSLCDRYQIDNSARTLHGALLDAQLLAEVYLAMTRGQESLLIDEDMLEITIAPVRGERRARGVMVLLASAEEMESHEQALVDIARACGRPTVWQRLAERAVPLSLPT